VSNPLVASASGTGPGAWTGVWIAEDIEQTVQGVQNGSWIDGSLGTLSAGLDALAFVSDPIGSLLQYGVAWLIEHVKPLSEALDWLAGDPAQIAAQAQTWRNVATDLAADADDLARAVRWEVSDWSGSAAEAYRQFAERRVQALTALGRAADGLALITEGAVMLIGTVRTMVRDAIATVVSRLIVYAGELVGTLGVATPLVVEQVSTLCASWAAKITHWLKSLLSSLRELGGAMRRLAENITKLRSGLEPMGKRSDWRDPADHPQTPTRTPDSQLPGGDPVYHSEHSTAIGYDSNTMRNFDAAGPEPGFHDVVVHGGEGNGQFRPGLIDAGGANHAANYTHPNQIADAIRNNPNYTGGPVRLVSCHTGVVDEALRVPSAAQQVADSLGVPVKAPTNAVGVPRRGGPGLEPIIFEGGVWKMFYPGGGQ
jgi:hypothetical protein